LAVGVKAKVTLHRVCVQLRPVTTKESPVVMVVVIASGPPSRAGRSRVVHTISGEVCPTIVDVNDTDDDDDPLQDKDSGSSVAAAPVTRFEDEEIPSVTVIAAEACPSWVGL